MRLEGWKEAYEYHSGKASDVARQLAFAGIAVIWIFHEQSAGKPTIPAGLLVPTRFLVGALGADLLQYAIAAATWGFFHRAKERENPDPKRDITAPPVLNIPGIVLFWSKIFCVVISYAYLLGFLFSDLI